MINKIELWRRSMKISYIVTVFNLDKYVDECLQSVIKNCQNDCEIIVVDDGSTDETGKICDNYSTTYDFVHVVHQENGGLANARNIGTRLANGEWLCFIDGDDYLLEDLTKTAREYLREDLDIVFFDNVSGKNSGEFVEISPDTLELFKVYAMYASPKYKKEPKFVNVHVTTQWAKFYRKQFLVENNLWSIESVVLAQDILFNLTVYAKNPRMGYIDKKFYHHRILFDSCCHRYRRNYGQISDIFIENLYAILEKSYNNDEEMLNYSYNTIINLLTNNFMLNLCNENNPAEESEREKEFLSIIQKPRYELAINNCNFIFLTEFQQKILNYVRNVNFKVIDDMCRKETKRKMFIGNLQNGNHKWILKIGVTLKAGVRKIKNLGEKANG